MNNTRFITILSLALFTIIGCNAKTDKSAEGQPENAADVKVAEQPEKTADIKAAEQPEKSADSDTTKAEDKAEAQKPEAVANAEVPPVVDETDNRKDNSADAPETENAQPEEKPVVPREYAKITGDSIFNIHYKHSDTTGVVCENPEGCDCNGVLCPMNAECGHKLSAEAEERCMCGNTPVTSDYTGYVCTEIAPGVFDLGCTEKDGCPCGKIKVYANMGCDGSHATCAGSPVPGRGLSCSRKPYEKWNFSLNCFKDECDCYGETISKGDVCPPLECKRGFEPSVLGCACNGHKDDGQSECVLSKDGKHVSYCASDDGCECGEETCPMGAACYHKKCVDRATLKPIPEGYTLSFGVPKCTEETCACGKKGTCQQGKYCLDGICISNPYRRKLLDGKMYYYHIFDKDLVDAGPKEQYRNDLWSLMFVNLKNPDNENEFEYICNYFNPVKVKGSDEDICQSDKYQNNETTINEMLMHCGTGEIPENVANMYCMLDVVDGVLQFSGWQEE